MDNLEIILWFISKFVKIENIPTYFIIFQAFLIFLFSIGPIKTIKMVLKFPAYLITPMFSFWTMGLVSKNLFCCCFCCFDCSDTAKKYHYNRRLIGVSFWYTWINAGISFGIAIGRKIDWFFFMCSKLHYYNYSSCNFPYSSSNSVCST